MSKKVQRIQDELGSIVSCADAWVFGPVSEAIVSAAEVELDLIFPVDYRAFLLGFGAAKVFDLEIFGVPDTRDTDQLRPPTFFNVIDQTLSLRNNPYNQASLPRHFVYFALDATGGGYSFFLDTSTHNNLSLAPVLAKHANAPFRTIAPDFIEFLRRLRSSTNGFLDLLKSSSPFPEKKAGIRSTESLSRNDKDDTRKRTIRWLQIIPDPCPPDLPVLAQHFGVDVDSRDVFVYGPSADLSLEQQMEAFAADAGFFADPAYGGETRHPYASIDYIIDHFSGLPQASLFPQLKKVVLDAYDAE